MPFDSVRLAVTGGATGVIDGVMQAADRNQSYMDNTLAEFIGDVLVLELNNVTKKFGGLVAVTVSA